MVGFRRASLRSRRIVLRREAFAVTSGFTLWMVCHESHGLSGGADSSVTCVPGPEPPSIRFGHHDPGSAGALVPIRISLCPPRLPSAWRNASHISAPPRASQDPGSSAKMVEKPANPMARLPLEDRIRSFVPVSLCVQASRWPESSHRYSSSTSARASRTKFSSTRLCSSDALTPSTSTPRSNVGDPGRSASAAS